MSEERQRAELVRGEPCPTCGLTMSLFHTAHPNQDADHVRHVQVETPHWDTKVRCACKADFTSRCEFWKHQADAYLRLIDGPEVHQHTMVTDDDGHQWCAHCDAQFDGLACAPSDADSNGIKE